MGRKKGGWTSRQGFKEAIPALASPSYSPAQVCRSKGTRHLENVRAWASGLKRKLGLAAWKVFSLYNQHQSVKRLACKRRQKWNQQLRRLSQAAMHDFLEGKGHGLVFGLENTPLIHTDVLSPRMVLWMHHNEPTSPLDDGFLPSPKPSTFLTSFSPHSKPYRVCIIMMLFRPKIETL